MHSRATAIDGTGVSVAAAQLFNTRSLSASPAPSLMSLTMSGEELTRWTIRVALAAYVGRLAVGLAIPRRSAVREPVSRWLWTLGCLFLWIHVGCAFHFHHQWSHARAFAHTARETAAVTGLDWGGGIWLNYLVMLLWAGDVAWWWLAPRSFEARPAALDWIWQGWLAFVALNATVVFEAGAIRLAGVTSTIGICLLWIRRLALTDRPERRSQSDQKS
jgi:hypothetical protein